MGSMRASGAVQALRNIVKSKRRTTRLALMSLTAAAALPALESVAATSQWIGGTSSWNTAGNWSPSGVPGSGATVNATGTTAASQTITYNYNGTAQSLGTLTVNLTGGSGGASEILLMNGTFTLAAVTESVGGFVGTPAGGNGNINQSAGQNTIGAGFLILGYNATDQGTYSLSGTGILTSASSEIVGNNGAGFFNQSGGTNSLSNTQSLYVGDNTGSTGTYVLSGGSLAPTGFEAIGNGGNGLFDQVSGTNTLGSGQSLFMGSPSGSTGTYLQSGGSLSVSGTEVVASSGMAIFTQSGGTNTISSSTNLNLAQGAGSTGTYVLIGTGALSVGGNELVGDAGIGTFNQTNGTNTLTGATSYLSLGASSGATGIYNLSGGNASAVNMYVGGTSSGAGGKGVLTVSGAGVLNLATTGTLTLYNTSGSGLTLAGGTINTGAVNFSDNLNNFNFTSGTLNILNSNFTTVIDPSGNLASSLTIGPNQVLAMAGNEQIAGFGTATLTQTGGANVVENAISIAAGGGGNGTYNLSGGGVTANGMYVGVGGPGLVNQTGGTYAGTSSSNFISIGPNANQTGTYVLSGGSVSVFYDAVGAFGIGLFNQSGGTQTIPNGGTLWLALNSGATGTYVLSGSGVLSAPFELDGNNGPGLFNQSGGTNTVGSTLYIGDNGGISGTYNLSGGTLAMGGTEFVGFNGNGIFNQTGGANAGTAGVISVGAQPGSTGTYVLSGTGSVSLDAEYIGAFGTGAFIQSGGANAITVGSLYIAANGGSTGTYILSGSGTLSDNGYESIGNQGLGLFNQSGGTNTINNGNQLYLAYYGGSTATYALSGGSLFLGGAENIGSSGVATFNQTGGVNAINGINNLYIANGTGGTGTYAITGGTANVSGNVDVSSSGALGFLNVGGSGVMNIGGTLLITNSGTSAVNLSGGTINTAALDFGGIPSLLNWTGGTLNLTNTVIFDSDAANTTTSDAFLAALSIGSNQTLMVTGNETLGGVGPFSLTLNNGSQNYVTGTLTINPTGTITGNSGSSVYGADIVLAGGNVNGTLTNQANFQYQSGSFNGRLLNEYAGTVSFGASFTAGNGLANYGSITLNAGQTLIDNGAGLDNLGTLNLGGAVLSGSGPVINDYGGTLNGGGTINPAFINNGLVDLSGTLLLNSATAAVNNGMIEGAGTIVGNFSNAGSGTIDVPASGELAITSAWINAGLIESPAGGFLTGGAITNTGTIEGAGQIGSPISNTTGTIRASGGELVLSGTGDSNSVSGQIQSATGDTVFYSQGLAANAGDIALTGGAFDNNNHAITSTGYISGWGTFRSGGLTNSGFMYIGGNFDAFGPVINGASGTINATGSGLNAFFGPVTNNSGGSFSVQGGASVTFFNSYTGNAPVNNSGTVTFAVASTSGAITGGGQTIVGDGSTSSLQLIATGGTSSQSALQIVNGSTVDITNNDFFVTYGTGADPISAIASYLTTGYASEKWTGVGIDSSTVAHLNATQSALIYAIGYADGADGLVTGLSPGEIEIMPTLAGDAKLQGDVVFGDFQVLAEYFGKSGGWDEGNFTYGSTIDFGDFQVLAQDFGANNSALTAGESASLNNFAGQFGDALVANPDGVGFSLVSVPEPASATVFAAAACGMLTRRRRTRSRESGNSLQTK